MVEVGYLFIKEMPANKLIKPLNRVSFVTF